MFSAFSEVVFGGEKGSSMEGSGKSKKAAPPSNITSRGSGSSSRRQRSVDNKENSDGSAKLNKQVETLKNDLLVKDSVIDALSARLAHLEDDDMNAKSSGTNGNRQQSLGGGTIVHRQHVMPVDQHIVGNDSVFTKRIETRESVLTNRILDSIDKPEKSRGQELAEKMIEACQNSSAHMQYLNSKEFADDLMIVCEEIECMLEDEPRVIFLQSPCYVFGDIHGNLEDLQFFADNVWKMGMNLTAGKFLFLGDYVDRGMQSLECTAYLFSLKLLYPHKIFMLRGNHETRDVNGWEEHYGEKSFIRQCKDRFGAHVGR